MALTASQVARSFAGPLVVGFLLAGGLVLALTGSPAHALGVLLGPFAGGYAREWQSCCAEASWGLAPYGVGALAAGLALRLLLRPGRRWRLVCRSLVWWFAALFWYVTALISYAHALE